MRLLAERLAVGIRRIARVLALVVRVRPLGLVRIARGMVECMMRIAVACAVLGIASRRLGEAGRRLARLLLLGALVVHDPAATRATSRETLCGRPWNDPTCRSV